MDSGFFAERDYSELYIREQLLAFTELQTGSCGCSFFKKKTVSRSAILTQMLHGTQKKLSQVIMNATGWLDFWLNIVDWLII